MKKFIMPRKTLPTGPNKFKKIYEIPEEDKEDSP